MKVQCLAGALVLLPVFAAGASAQLIAGTPEDELFGQIEAAASNSERLELSIRFESEFPGSPVHVQILTMIMNIYNQEQDSANAMEYARKLLDEEEDNVEALIALTYNLALTREDVAAAIEYGERAIAVIGELRSTEAPVGYTPESWPQYLDTLEASAESYLNYARTVQ